MHKQQYREYTLAQFQDARGLPVYSSDREKIGSVDEIFYDDDTREPEWIGIGTGFLGTKHVLVPVEGAELRDDGFHVPYDKDTVKDSPDIDEDEISEQTESQLYSYYGLRYSERRSKTVPSEGGKASRGDRETVTRHEERLQVGKHPEDAGRARLRKWVETEPVDMDVELKRETARVTREQVDRPAPDAAFGEDEVEMRLREEKADVSKQTVAKERVGLEKDVDTRKETVRDELRKERVEVEGDVKDRKGRK